MSRIYGEPLSLAKRVQCCRCEHIIPEEDAYKLKIYTDSQVMVEANGLEDVDTYLCSSCARVVAELIEDWNGGECDCYE